MGKPFINYLNYTFSISSIKVIYHKVTQVVSPYLLATLVQPICLELQSITIISLLYKQ